MAGPVLSSHLGEAVREVVPPWMVPVFYGITMLGNIGFLLVLFALDYWFGAPRRGAHALGLAVAGMAVITVLKFFFAIPRPPPAVNSIPISGYSFPSGHATASTIAYGILAYDLRIGTARLRYAVASLLVALIALSRVVLGVHYVRDVVAGILIGVAFLAAAFTLTRHVPSRGFSLALALAVVALLVSNWSHDGVAVLGAATGAAVAWYFLDAMPTVQSTSEYVVLLGGVLPMLGVLGYVGTLSGVDLFVAFLLNAVTLSSILVAPLVVSRVVH